MSMRRMRSIMGQIVANAAGFAAAQTTVAGTPLTLASATLPAPTAGQLHNSAVPVQFTGVAATIASNYTIVGFDRHGQLQTEIVVGPVGAVTTTGHLLFNKIQSITPSVTNNPGTIAVGFAGSNYGPWLITAWHSSGAFAIPIGTAPTYLLQVTDFNLLDATFFHAAVGGGGTPVNDINSGNGYFSPTDAPYIDNPPFPMVPALLQTSCPQLLGTNQCMPEDDGTFTQVVNAPSTFTADAAGGAAANAARVRLDPVVTFAWRLVITAPAAGLIELDVTPQRRAY